MTLTEAKEADRLVQMQLAAELQQMINKLPVADKIRLGELMAEQEYSTLVALACQVTYK